MKIPHPSTILLVLIAALLLCACRGSRLETTNVRTDLTVRADTVRLVRVVRDTLRERDSIHVTERLQGETLRIEFHHWHTRTVTRTLYDTVQQHSTDTLRLKVEERNDAQAGKGVGARWTGAAVLAFSLVSLVIIWRKWQ